MEINLKRLKESLIKETYCESFRTGLFRVIDYAHNSASSDQIDWDSFTVEDVNQALEMAMYYVDDESASEEDFVTPPNQGNAIHEYLHNTQIIHEIRNMNPMKKNTSSVFF